MNEVFARDFFGYGDNPPHAQWPNDARVAVSFVLNVEEGAELSITAGDERNESVYEIVEEIIGAPDFAMESHFEYGTRAGYWRMMKLFDEFNIKTTLNACVRALERSPWLAKDAIARGHEISCHSYRWENQVFMKEQQEREMIHHCIRSITELTGVRPVGWHTRSAPSVNTRRLLVEEGGFLYDSNEYNDDLPYVVQVEGKPMIILPYSFDTNDMRFFNGRGFTHASDFSRYCIDAFDWLWEEGAHRPKMMTIGLHLRVMGRPARMHGLMAFLEHIRNKGSAWVARRDEIARHWVRLIGLDSAG